ncbi:hypothetical protein [Croceicoccus sp. Ery15]|uniref:hypothetical protein n=1 Tax=Croceicoccus sp. Ery15 TaxID=1703338 RepID=UPI001E657192|nr:hypothetical protein [Croceicoccus sp. Ery15]
MKKIMLTVAAASLLAAGPAMAVENARTSAPANEASQLEGTPLLAAAALVAFLAVIVIAAGDDKDDEPVSA